MKKFYTKLLFAFILFLFFFSSGYSQVENFIYCVNNASSGVFRFSKIETSTGTLTDLSPVLITSIAGAAGSFIDNYSKTYYLNTGTSLIGFDAVTGSMISNVTIAIPSGAEFFYAAFNPCDSNVYGIINNYPTNISFARLNPKTGATTVISALSNGTVFTLGAMSFIDPSTGVYFFENSSLPWLEESIKGLNVSDGQTVYNTSIINLPNQTFGHFALKCSTHEIFGTSANTSAGVKYFATINLNSGVVSHVSDEGWNRGVMKPLSGGDCINQITGNYYYSGSPHLSIEINSTTGDTVSVRSVNAGELLFVQHFSQCSCSVSGIDEAAENISLHISPNPANTLLNIQCENFKPQQIVVYDINGQKLSEQKFAEQLDVSALPRGIYFMELKNIEASVRKKFVKM